MGCVAEIEAMIEVAIERWTGADGTTDYRWSVWRDGHRIAMGSTAFSSSDDCESEALDFCMKGLGRKPDKVTRL